MSGCDPGRETGFRESQREVWPCQAKVVRLVGIARGCHEWGPAGAPV